MKFKPRRPTLAPTPAPRSNLARTNRCHFSTSDGRQCRMLCSATHPALCAFHATQERHLLEADRIGAELASLSGEFKTASDVNHALGKLFALLAANRIPPRNAAILAYIGQLLLHSVPSVKNEIERAQGWDAWERTLREVFARHARALAVPAPAPPR